MIYPKPCSIYLRGTIDIKQGQKPADSSQNCGDTPAEHYNLTLSAVPFLVSE